MKKIALIYLISSLFLFNHIQANDKIATSTQKLATSKADSDRHLNDLLIFRLAEPHLMVNNEIHIDILFRLGQKISLGPTFALMGNGEHLQAGSAIYNRSSFTDTTSRKQYGLKAAYYFKHVNLSSPYISIHGRYAFAQIQSSSKNPLSGQKNGTGEMNSRSFGTTMGYQWQSGMIKLYLGGGVQQHHAPDDITITYSNGSRATIELTSSNHADFVVDGGLALTF